MKINTPVLFVNFKTYKEATGFNALSLAKIIEKVSLEKNASTCVVVQATDLRMVSEATTLPVFAQHIDAVNFGPHTGHILPESVKLAGAIGTVLNHAENKRDNDFLKAAVSRAKEAGLQVMVCAETIQRAKEIASFKQKPDFIAIEPPELIGGKISVSTAKPELIADSVKAIHSIAKIPVVTGAGINSAQDVRKAVELGTVGVFVASSIVKAKNVSDAVTELLKGFE